MKSNFNKVFIAGVAAFSILVAGFVLINMNSGTGNRSQSPSPSSAMAINEKQPASSDTAQVSFNEVFLKEDELITGSDLIVKGKFSKVKERAVSKVKGAGSKIATGNESPEPAEVEMPYVVYEFKVSENLADENSKLDTVNVVMVDGNLGLGNPEDLPKEKGECVLFLHKNPNDTYNLVSYSQGFRKVKENQKEMETMASKEVSNYDELKAKVKARRK